MDDDYRVIFVMLIELLAGIFFLAAWFVSDAIITSKRIKENQIAWNEYSKGMTAEEKLDCFADFLYERRMEKGWKFFYIPKI